jgi:ADP-ribosylglycohydrolase
MELTKRYRGGMYGAAIGDAVGTTVEFKSPGQFAPVTDMVGGGEFNLKPGEWTDDFSRILCAAESLVKCGGWNPNDYMARQINWRDFGYLSSNGYCFDIGTTTQESFAAFESTGNPYAGSTDRAKASNGSLMGLLPIVLAYGGNFEAMMEVTELYSRTTHGGRVAIDGCRYFAALILAALQGATKEQILSSRYTPIPGYWDDHPLCQEIDSVAAGSFKHKQPPEIRGTGWVVHSIEAALWAFHNSTSYEEGCLKAANLGEDADTTACIYGQLAGAFYGEDGLPQRWRQRVVKREWIEGFADDLLKICQRGPKPFNQNELWELVHRKRDLWSHDQSQGLQAACLINSLPQRIADAIFAGQSAAIATSFGKADWERPQGQRVHYLEVQPLWLRNCASIVNQYCVQAGLDTHVVSLGKDSWCLVVRWHKGRGQTSQANQLWYEVDRYTTAWAVDQTGARRTNSMRSSLPERIADARSAGAEIVIAMRIGATDFTRPDNTTGLHPNQCHLDWLHGAAEKVYRYCQTVAGAETYLAPVGKDRFCLIVKFVRKDL